MADAFIDGVFQPAPNYCPYHPTVNRGNYTFGSSLFSTSYQFQCPRCIVEVIRSLSDDTRWPIEFHPDVIIDKATIQLVLDVLDQKLGLS